MVTELQTINNTKSVDKNKLNASEKRALHNAEKVIEKGIKTFEEVGRALVSIKDGKLYRATHANFADYCEERWGIVKSHANRLIDYTKVVDVVAELAPAGVPAPTTTRQTRELKPLIDEPEVLAEAWTEVVEQTNGTPTGDDVREVVRPIIEAREVPTVEEAADLTPLDAETEAIVDAALEAAREATGLDLAPEDAPIAGRVDVTDWVAAHEAEGDIEQAFVQTLDDLDVDLIARLVAAAPPSKRRSFFQKLAKSLKAEGSVLTWKIETAR